MKTKDNGYLEKIIQNTEACDIPYELWDVENFKQFLPIYDLKCFAPAKTIDDEAFGLPTGGVVCGGVFFPTAGYVTDPQLSAHNL